MKRTLPLITMAVLLSANADAQGVKFGRRYMKQRVEQKMNAANRQAASAKAEQAAMQSATRGGEGLEEYEEKRGDVIYRYVYAFDKDLMRSSETIYMKEKNADGTWGEETLYDVGTYLYEYDGSGRVKTKTVSYGRNERFVTYRVTVDYGDDITTYSRYELNTSDNSYVRTKQWSCYADGQLASVSVYDTYYNELEHETLFDENGLITAEASRYSKYERTGTLNDSTIYWYKRNSTDGDWLGERVEAYRYETIGAGRLAEYKCYEAGEYYTSYQERKFTFDYDEYGRLVSLKKYYNYDESGGEDVPSIVPSIDASETRHVDTSAAKKRADAVEPEWTLEYNETYEYWGDEVYGVGNSWHDVFGMEGPLTRIYLDDEGYITETVFERNASGKLLSVTSTDEDIEDVTETSTITVDDDGHITRIEDTSEETYGDYTYYDSEATDYTWEGEQVTTASNTWMSRNTVDGTSHEYTSTTNYQYAYGDGSVTVKYGYDPDGYNSEYTITDTGNRYSIVDRSFYNGTWNDNYKFLREVQSDDVSFIMPDISADMAGFSPDSIVVASVAGRVVCVFATDYSTDMTYGFHGVEEDNSYYNFMNAVDGVTYFAIEHDGDETVCSDINGLPIYVLANGRLVRQYIYYDEGNTVMPDYSDGLSQTNMSRAATVPAGQAYDEISYAYDSNGRLTGRTEVSVSSDGTRTEEISLEYTYNETVGIEGMAVAKAGITLTGRTLGMTDGSSFSVYSLDGRIIADDTTSFTATTQGVYIVKSGNFTAKVAVK